jgi:uncharacterized protein
MPVQAAGRSYSYEFMESCTAPKLFLTGAEDPFAPREVMEEVFAKAPGEKEMMWIDGAEHFFMGVPGSPGPKIEAMQAALRDWLTRNFFRDALY